MAVELNKTDEPEKKVAQVCFPIKYSVEEKSDFFAEQNRYLARFLYRYTIFILFVSMFLSLGTSAYLVFRSDSAIYASSGDGKIIWLETRETPDGSFKLPNVREALERGW